MLRLVVLMCLAACIIGETCDFAAYRQCLKNGKPEKHTEKLKQKEGGTELKSPVFKCLEEKMTYLSAKCQLPTQRPKENRKPDKVGFEKSRECFEKVLNPVKSSIEKCVQQVDSNFKFPEDKRGGKKRRGGHKGHNGKQEFQHLINSSCLTDQAKAKALACIEALPRHENNQTAKFCTKKAQCSSSLTAACQLQLVQLEQATCNCANTTITAQSAQLEAALEQCKPQVAGQPSTGNQKKHKNHGFDVKLLIRKFCPHRRDLCKTPN